MTCRHRLGDPACSKSPEGAARIVEELAKRRSDSFERREKELLDKIADYEAVVDNSQYEILHVEENQDLLIMQIKYESCSKCCFEGTKTIVFRATLLEAIKWKSIDPHFREELPRNSKEAPSPIARFTGDDVGLGMARVFVAAIQSNKGKVLP